jgi:hypothetical protein
LGAARLTSDLVDDLHELPRVSGEAPVGLLVPGGPGGVGAAGRGVPGKDAWFGLLEQPLVQVLDDVVMFA